MDSLDDELIDLWRALAANNNKIHHIASLRTL